MGENTSNKGLQCGETDEHKRRIAQKKRLARKKRRRKHVLRCMASAILGTAILFAGIIVVNTMITNAGENQALPFLGKEDNTVTHIEPEQVTYGENSDGAETNEDPAMSEIPLSNEEIEEIKQLVRDNPELLVLVNKEQEFDIDKQFKLKSICKGRLQAADIACEDLTKMLSGASDAGYTFWIASAYRSREKQQGLVDKDVSTNRKKGMSKEEALAETLKKTMPAGYSEHETGLAFDMLASSNTNMDNSQVYTKENQWIQEHCYEYGFILRYPKDKEKITQIDYEPWHFRYVGREAAELMHRKNLTLEELYKFL